MLRVMRTPILRLFLLLAAVLLPLAARAQVNRPPADVAAQAAQLRALLASDQGAKILELLGDPHVRQAVLQDNGSTTPNGTDATTAGAMMDETLTSVRTRLWTLADSLTRIPGELLRVSQRIRSALPGSEPIRLVVCIVVFLAAGIGAQMLFLRAARPWRVHFGTLTLSTPRERIAAVCERLVFATLVIAAFAAGSMGAYLLFAWPPLTGSIILGYLLAFLAIRLSLTSTRFFLAPTAEHLRLVPLSNEAAWFWHCSIAGLIGAAAIGWETIVTLRSFGMSEAALDVLLPLLLLLLASLAIYIVWSMPATASHKVRRSTRGHVPRLLISLALVLDWLLFLMGATELAWTLLIAGMIPVANFVVSRSMSVVLLGRWAGSGPERSAHVAIAERTTQALVVIVATAVLVHVWHIDMTAMSNMDTPMMRITRGLLEALVILVIADLLWQVVRVLIDARLAGDAPAIDSLNDNQLRRQARLRTLLPVLRNFAFVIVLVMASLSALAAMGLQIGPLLAGAGVVGIAVGFGAQTLVRDVISGIFFLLDDAFRVGEQIESGGIRGTVESFSLRSVKMRHLNGQLHTVPFGDLKAITNYSRDWVVERIQLVVTYDTDLDLLDNVVDTVNDELMADPAIAPEMIEPLRSLGVQAMIDTGMQIGLTFKTRPGRQFAVRRVIFGRIRAAFTANGIRFAYAGAQSAAGAESPATI
jgi:moderate conductance mechanosensitive channel